MKPYLKHIFIIKSFVAVAVAVSLTACGTSRHSDFDDNDGIYRSSSNTYETTEDNRNYYQQYFQTKSQLYADLPEDDILFTDIEAYSSKNTYIDENGVIHEEYVEYADPYGPWGETSEITINVYSNPGWGYYGGYYWHRPYWWYGSGWGINYWGYYGWGYPYYWSGWGYPYYAHWHSPYYYNPYYGGYSNYIAHNRGRRNTDINRPRTVNRGQTTTTQSNRGYSRSEIERRINNSRNSQTRNAVQQSRSGAQQSRNAVQQSRSNNQQTRNAVQQSRDNTTTRPAATNQNNMSRPNVNRNPGTINRGGGNMRSGGGSGTIRSGGGRGGRG